MDDGLEVGASNNHPAPFQLHNSKPAYQPSLPHNSTTGRNGVFVSPGEIIMGRRLFLRPPYLSLHPSRRSFAGLHHDAHVRSAWPQNRAIPTYTLGDYLWVRMNCTRQCTYLLG
ncbi:hypothetical protein LZ31DRAFT_104578 [Colletotrichum somersetense]|nr:hypothetical protein LZ31DRAFT_104578 [Colletotrichum somersetense]